MLLIKNHKLDDEGEKAVSTFSAATGDLINTGSYNPQVWETGMMN